MLTTAVARLINEEKFLVIHSSFERRLLNTGLNLIELMDSTRLQASLSRSTRARRSSQKNADVEAKSESCQTLIRTHHQQ
jgi:hypothetical protein